MEAGILHVTRKKTKQVVRYGPVWYCTIRYHGRDREVGGR